MVETWLSTIVQPAATFIERRTGTDPRARTCPPTMFLNPPNLYRRARLCRLSPGVEEPPCVRCVIRGHHPTIDDHRRPRIEGHVHLEAPGLRSPSRIELVAEPEAGAVTAGAKAFSVGISRIAAVEAGGARTWQNPFPPPTRFDQCRDPCATPGGGTTHRRPCGAGCRSRSANRGRRRDHRRRPRHRRSMPPMAPRPAGGSRRGRGTHRRYRPSGRGCRCKGGHRFRCRPMDRCRSGGIGSTLVPEAGSERTGAGQSFFRLAWVQTRGPVGSLGSPGGTAQSLVFGRSVGIGVGEGSGGGVASASVVGQSSGAGPTTCSLGSSPAVHRYAPYASSDIRVRPSGGSNSAAGCSPNAISVTSVDSTGMG